MTSPHPEANPRPLLAAAALVIVVAGLKAAGKVFVPVLLAFFLAVPCFPVIAWLRGKKLPGWAAILVTLLLLALLMSGFGAFVATSVDQMSELVPTYQAKLETLATPWLERARQEGLEVDKFLNIEYFFGLFGGLLGGMATLFSEGLVVLLITVFVLVEGLQFEKKLVLAIPQEGVRGRLKQMNQEIVQYLVIKTLVSLATGLWVGVWVWIQGLDLPLFWGVTAFLFNFVPNLGAFISAVPAVMLALVQMGPGAAVVTALAYVSSHMVIGNFVEPALMGKQLGLSPLTVLLSLLFWGWVWGIVGALLAVPLTMVIKIMLENSPSLAWLGHLMEEAGHRKSSASS